jgi:hypothetical protein
MKYYLATVLTAIALFCGYGTWSEISGRGQAQQAEAVKAALGKHELLKKNFEDASRRMVESRSRVEALKQQKQLGLNWDSQKEQELEVFSKVEVRMTEFYEKAKAELAK